MSNNSVMNSPPLPFSEACERNRDPILALLRGVFANRSQVLEIGSGTGQHAVYFAASLPHLEWCPTEQPDAVAALAGRIAAHGGPNVRAPVALDVSQELWPVRGADALFTANTLHIMSWSEVVELFVGLQRHLAPHAVVAIYGPFLYHGQYTSPSNREFDRWLKARDPGSGIRDLAAVTSLAEAGGRKLVEDHEMPANNRLIVFA